MTPTAPIPDALFLPEKVKRGRTQYERICSVADIAEPILGVDRSKGEKAWVRRQPGGWLFVTRDPEDTIYQPLDSALRGRERYAWMDRPDGSRWGYLTQEALNARRESEAKA